MKAGQTLLLSENLEEEGKHTDETAVKSHTIV